MCERISHNKSLREFNHQRSTAIMITKTISREHIKENVLRVETSVEMF